MQANKDGFYYVLDRITGQFISGQPFAQVTWAKGLDEVTGRPIVNQEAHYGNQSITISPGPGGAHNWAPMSFNPKTGLVYIPTSTNSTSNFAIDPNFTVKPGRSNTGLIPGNAGGRGGPAAEAPGEAAKRLPPPPAIGPVPANGERRALVAWDPATQQERWRAPDGGSIGGGTVTTAGNLVFQVSPDGRLLAYSADKGEKLLDVNTGLAGGMGPPITWQLDGKQYVTVAGGVGKVVPRYQDQPAAPAPPPAGGPTGTNVSPDLAPNAPPPATPAIAPRMITFVLDGKAL
jgi:quinohemoprotein ethanol dehydrogenase